VIESLLKFDETEVADTSIELSKAMCKELDLKAEQLIVDLVKSRKPKSIHIKGDRLQDQPKYLEDESDVIGAIESKIYLKAYIHPALSHKISENDVDKHLKKELETWS